MVSTGCIDMRSGLNHCVGQSNRRATAVATITNTATDARVHPRRRSLLLLRAMSRNVNGHSRYHCSSTARLHRCRNSDGVPEKYVSSEKICDQLAR